MWESKDKFIQKSLSQLTCVSTKKVWECPFLFCLLIKISNHIFDHLVEPLSCGWIISRRNILKKRYWKRSQTLQQNRRKKFYLFIQEMPWILHSWRNLNRSSSWILQMAVVETDRLQPAEERSPRLLSPWFYQVWYRR